ncbi:hypothetical protein QQF64_011485 [Cirrhinus molitorella]|uniref:SGNH hydrolase-type esterase domain-containing protein n=1 Tax=Cirrhinus molitorella TaxID=172907 RepID=A0ABR3M1U7_9TELE
MVDGCWECCSLVLLWSRTVNAVAPPEHQHKARGKNPDNIHVCSYNFQSVLRFNMRISAILKDESVGAIVLHAGVNDTRLRQTEVLKRDFSSLIETVRSTAPETRIIVSGPLPTYRRGHERLYRADGLHPSRVGAELLSDNISRTLRSI